MNWRIMLSLLLVAQLGLAGVLTWGREHLATVTPSAPLLALDWTQVDGLRIAVGEMAGARAAPAAGGDGAETAAAQRDSTAGVGTLRRGQPGTQALVLRRGEAGWVLPALADAPANTATVRTVLDRLATLEKGWPVATTAAALARFQVAADDFERRLDLLAGDQVLGTLYVGSSPGFRQVHLRPADEEAVFAATLDAWQLSAKPADWLDKALLALDPAQITAIDLPGLRVQRAPAADAPPAAVTADLTPAGASTPTLWQLLPAPDADVDQAKVADLVDTLAYLRVQDVLPDALPESAESALVLTVTRQPGAPLTYRFYRREGAATFALQRDDRPQTFVVASATVEQLLSTGRGSLAQPAAVGEGVNRAEVGDPGREAAPPQQPGGDG